MRLIVAAGALLLATAQCVSLAPRTAVPLPPPELSAEARCALTLLPTYLGDEQGFGLLHVVAAARWVNDAFLGRLSVIGVPLTIEQYVDVETKVDVLVDSTQSDKTLILVAAESADVLPKLLNDVELENPIRYLVWLSAGSNSNAHFVKVRAEATKYCQMEMRLAVTSVASGDTRLYNVEGGCELSKNLSAIGLSYSVLPNVTELDRCSAESGWQRGVPFPYRACVTWQSRPGEDDALEALVETSATTGEEHRLAKVIISALQRYRRVYERRISFKLPSGLYEVWQKHWDCNVELIVHPSMVFSSKTFFMFPWQVDGLVAVIPVALRHHGHLGLSSLTKPLTMTMWCATVAAAAAVWIGLWLHGTGNSCLEAGLQTVSPLLSQPPHPVPVSESRQRRILAVWLLASVVLSAAYLCDLKSALAAPDVTKQIRNERELEASNITIIYSKLTQIVTDRTWQGHGHNVLVEDLNEGDGMQRVAEKRDAALITDTTRLAYLLRGHEKKMYTLRIAGGDRIKTILYTTRGSPLEAPLRKVIPRLRAAGLLEREAHRRSRKPSGDKKKPSPLGWESVVPAFTVLGEGLAAALGVFLGEVCAGSACKLRSWARGASGSRHCTLNSE